MILKFIILLGSISLFITAIRFIIGLFMSLTSNDSTRLKVYNVIEVSITIFTIFILLINYYLKQ